MNVSDLKMHHIGVAVPAIADAAEAYAGDGWICGKTIFDPRQNVRICFAEKPDEIPHELVEPAAENSPVSAILRKNGGEPEAYHVCYAVEDLERTIADLRAEKWLLVRPPVPAVALGNARVAFLYSPGAGLIELLEKSLQNA